MTCLASRSSRVLLWHSRLRVLCCHSSGLGAAEAQVQSPAWELPHASGVAKISKIMQLMTEPSLNLGFVFI